MKRYIVITILLGVLNFGILYELAELCAYLANLSNDITPILALLIAMLSIYGEYRFLCWLIKFITKNKNKNE